jgi:hypothetical protein
MVSGVRNFSKCISPDSLMCAFSCTITKIALRFYSMYFCQNNYVSKYMFYHISSNIWFNTLYIGFMFRIVSVTFDMFIIYMFLSMFSFPYSGIQHRS